VSVTGAAAALAAAAMSMPGMGSPAATGDVVTIPGKFYSPGELTVLVGDTVTWRNDDAISHTVTSEGGAFAAGSLAPGVSFQETFAHPGTYAYYCTIHRQMRGTITVAALGLTGPAGVLAPGDEAMFDVLAPAGAGPVTLERALAGGGFEPVGESMQPGSDGHAMLHAMADGPGRYRVRAGQLVSSVVRLAVAPRVTATVHRSGRRVTVAAKIAPAVPGATVELQRYVRERFDYLPVQTVRSKAGAAVTFRYSTRSRAALRVAVTKAPGGWSPGTSRFSVVPAAGRPQHHR
jgi:plastocyanin